MNDDTWPPWRERLRRGIRVTAQARGRGVVNAWRFWRRWRWFSPEVMSAPTQAATELLMTKQGWTADVSYRWLRRSAEAEGIAVDDAAERVLSGRLCPPDEGTAAP